MIRLAFLVNGEPASAAALRARAFATAFCPDVVATIEYRSGSRIATIGRFLAALSKNRPHFTYVMDMAYSGVLAGGIYRLLTGNRMIVDTGDAIAELSRSVGERGQIGLWLTRQLERFGLWVVDAIVVRGTRHAELLADLGKKVTVVRDGVDLRTFRPINDSALRERLAPGARFTIGLVGTLSWSERLGIGYGWELVEIVHLLRDENVAGIIVGGGSGIERLRSRCRELGIEDRVHFAGYIEYDELPRYLGTMDVCLSTQTNDIPGNVRTTGKLPIYLAAGGVILASRVGEAAILLDDGQLVEYDGVVDLSYPSRLAERVRSWIPCPQEREARIAANRVLAARFFDYRVLIPRVVSILHALSLGEDP